MQNSNPGINYFSRLKIDLIRYKVTDLLAVGSE